MRLFLTIQKQLHPHLIVFICALSYTPYVNPTVSNIHYIKIQIVKKGYKTGKRPLFHVVICFIIICYTGFYCRQRVQTTHYDADALYHLLVQSATVVALQL